MCERRSGFKQQQIHKTLTLDTKLHCQRGDGWPMENNAIRQIQWLRARPMQPLPASKAQHRITLSQNSGKTNFHHNRSGTNIHRYRLAFGQNVSEAMITLSTSRLYVHAPRMVPVATNKMGSFITLKVLMPGSLL